MATGRDLHIDTPLTNMMVRAFNAAPNFVAGQVFPVVPVAKQSNVYYTLDQASFLQSPTTYRSPKTLARRADWKVSSDTYFAHNYAFADGNSLEDLDNADNAIQLRQTSTEFVTQVLLRDFESRAVTKIQANVASLSQLTGANAWDAVNSADIISPVRNAKQYIYQNTGIVPNSIVLDWMTYDYATRNTLAWAKLQYTQDTGQLTMAHLKSLWDVQNVYVSNATQNNAKFGATGSYTSIWGPTCFVYYRPPVLPTLKTAAYGAAMRWTPAGLPGPMAVTRQVFSGAGTQNEEVIEGGYYQDEKVIASALGFYINTKSGTPW